MPFEWLEEYRNTEISQNEKWWLIDTAIKENISYSLSQSSLRDTLRYYGFSFGNSEFSSRYQSLRDFGQKFDYFGKIGINRLANDESLPQVTWIQGRYRYVATYQLENADTGNLYTKTIGIDYNESLTPAQALDLIIQNAIEKYKLPPYAVDSMRIRGALFNPDWFDEDE